jgi:hypothetical protein
MIASLAVGLLAIIITECKAQCMAATTVEAIQRIHYAGNYCQARLSSDEHGDDIIKPAPWYCMSRDTV